MITNHKKLIRLVVKAMREQAVVAGTDKAEVDISGGVDSAVVAALACKAFGPDNVIGVYSCIHSSVESKKFARLVSETFKFRLVELDLTGEFNSIICKVHREFDRLGIPTKSRGHHPTIEGGFKSCLRAPVGRFVNRVFGGGIRQGTGNRDEDELIRFYQKGGDGEVDCNWIAGLFKSEVWSLAKYLGVPQEVIDAEPTPDLWAGDDHKDEEELKDLTGVPLTYTRPDEPMGTIEWVIRENDKHGIIDGLLEFEPVHNLDYTAKERKVIAAVREMEKATRHKAELPPTLSRESLVGEKVVQ